MVPSRWARSSLQGARKSVGAPHSPYEVHISHQRLLSLLRIPQLGPAHRYIMLPCFVSWGLRSVAIGWDEASVLISEFLKTTKSEGKSQARNSRASGREASYL